MTDSCALPGTGTAPAFAPASVDTPSATARPAGTTGSASSDGYTGRPRISFARGLTKYTSYGDEDSRYVATK